MTSHVAGRLEGACAKPATATLSHHVSGFTSQHSYRRSQPVPESTHRTRGTARRLRDERGLAPVLVCDDMGATRCAVRRATDRVVAYTQCGPKTDHFESV